MIGITILLIAATVLTACASAAQDESEAVEPTATLRNREIDLELPEPPFDDQETRVLLDRLTTRNLVAERDALLDRIVQSGDRRFVAALIEVMRATEIGVLPFSDYEAIVRALQQLSGELIVSWPDWITWYANTDLEAPPGFVEWKGRLLAGIDPNFARFFDEDFASTIRVEEIVWGGVRLDGIPALDNPKLIPAREANYIDPDDIVFGVSINGDNRAYPLRILDWHEMFNDVVGGAPVSLAYCTLCGAGVLYDGRVGDQVYTFGSSGFLMRSNKLMYDRNTYTLWNQLTGEPVLGPLADSGIQLKLRPVVVSTWRDWLDQHPDTQILDLNTGVQRLYEPGAAYGDYFASPETMFPVALRRDLLAQKDRVFAMQIDGLPRAYPTRILTQEVVVNDTVADNTLVLIAPRGDLSDSGADLRTGFEAQWQAGAEVRAFERGDHTFARGPDQDSVLDENGDVWRVTEEALVGPDGEQLARLPGHLAYWFGWFNYFPQTTVYGVDG
jgi:hypothetical protein